jgi:hypothetical protein
MLSTNFVPITTSLLHQPHTAAITARCPGYWHLGFSTRDNMETIFGSGSSVNHTSSWQPQPTFRGTFGILSTCLVTLGLCVWSAIHLNIPARNEAPWDFICALSIWKKTRNEWPWKKLAWPGQSVRKIGWTLLGFFAPELVRLSCQTGFICRSGALVNGCNKVAFAAYQQYRTAKDLTKALEKRLSPGTDPEVCVIQPPPPLRLLVPGWL